LETTFQDTSVLVTGGCGFIGSHLVESLVAAGANVTVLDNLQAGKWSNLASVSQDVFRIEGDVRDVEMVERCVQKAAPHYVFHLAANASVPGSVKEPLYDFQTNCAGTVNLLNALRGSDKCQKIVLASSGAVYGEPKSFPIYETDTLCPISPYGASKLSAEVEAGLFNTVYGVPVTIARLFNAYGPRMARFVILDFLRKLQKDNTILEVLGNGRQIRDFTYVSDTVNGLLILATRGELSKAYNLSSGTTCSITALAHTILAALSLNNKTEIVYTGQSWIGDAQHWEVSIAQLQSLGYQPKVTLEQGLSQVIEWFFKDERH